MSVCRIRSGQSNASHCSPEEKSFSEHLSKVDKQKEEFGPQKDPVLVQTDLVEKKF